MVQKLRRIYAFCFFDPPGPGHYHEIFAALGIFFVLVAGKSGERKEEERKEEEKKKRGKRRRRIKGAKINKEDK